MFAASVRCLALAAVTASAVTFLASPAVAVVLETAAGAVLLDQLGDQGRRLIGDIQAAGDALIAQAGEEAAKRGKEILDHAQVLLEETGEKLIGKVGDEADRVITDAIARLGEERKAAIKDLATVLAAATRDAECAASRVVGNELASLTASWFGSGSITLQAPYRVDDPLWEDQRWALRQLIWPREHQIHVVQYSNNRELMYTDAVRAMSVFVNNTNVTENTDARYVVGTWEYLSGAAYSAACYYPGNADRLVESYLYYKAKADLWKRYLPLRGFWEPT